MPITKKQLIQMLINSDIPDDAVILKELHGEPVTILGEFYGHICQLDSDGEVETYEPLGFDNLKTCNAFEII